MLQSVGGSDPEVSVSAWLTGKAPNKGDPSCSGANPSSLLGGPGSAPGSLKVRCLKRTGSDSPAFSGFWNSRAPGGLPRPILISYTLQRCSGGYVARALAPPVERALVLRCLRRHPWRLEACNG
ncbi:hypothetical protein NDU88_003885 [Pleurodeles waltl]|uniref:Uncharacterized protein n=1 Tax=Pleurodeles waltl TaxID=8319 RepID=A0AAV7KWT6_PLEWA|nr:hypothetical protein NDU88_003885 [Pleurodeles waltl]